MTPERAKELLPVIQAISEGRAVEVNECDGSNKWAPFRSLTFHDCCSYRIKPKPKRVPLGPEDVPPGAIVRSDRCMGAYWAMVVRVSGGKIHIGAGDAGVDYTNLMEYEISRDNGKTWQPCWKEVEP